MSRETDSVVGLDDFLATVMQAVSRAEDARAAGPGGSVERQTVVAGRPIVTLGLTYMPTPGAAEGPAGGPLLPREKNSEPVLRITHEDATRAERIAESIQQVPFQANLARVLLREKGAADRLASSVDAIAAVAASETQFAAGLVGQLDDSVLENLMLSAGVSPDNLSTLKGVVPQQNGGLGELLILNGTMDRDAPNSGETVLGATFQRGAGMALVGAGLLGVAAITKSPIAAGAGVVLMVVGAGLMLQ